MILILTVLLVGFAVQQNQGFNVEVLLESVDSVSVNLEIEPTYPINNINGRKNE